MPGGFELIIILLVMVALMWFMSRGARKAQAKQAEEREKALVVGTNVVTTSGFFGRIVDIDGDAVTLESPSGDETVWMKRAILQQMDLPLGYVADDEPGSDVDAPSPFSQKPEENGPFSEPDSAK
ncbi:preprotein translocase subunit YajC [Arcanobacterium wilhelmae]|uniref:Preprotein translocase subunit YajC n=1 Tax=Arcanobacterium wilhelmae TaxID=1803177 RepID=A0ABT9N8N5_9ACTO|nr:preprotein translocase subunit YajC [Arcanobacterium wilhelmae]MDP9800062.1 preprotein translocase subunit YajC [Arcanobacterium wilhelmae]WFN89557.1 preprotein translocase subunit YajC [Arcanobacterium wilhelmae]